jgi:hypothetical protein
MNLDNPRFPSAAPDQPEHPMAPCFRTLEIEFAIDHDGDLISGITTEYGPCHFILRHEHVHGLLWARAHLPLEIAAPNRDSMIQICNLINARANNICLCLDPYANEVVLRISTLAPERTPWPEHFGAQFICNLVSATGIALRAVAPVAVGQTSPKDAYQTFLATLSQKQN